jgi:putative zinc finger/helix-turn-helix YgiT family protein
MRTSTKTKKKSHPCPCCEEGHMVVRKLSFKTELEGKAVTIPKIEMEKCNSCGETFLTPGGSRHVDDWLDEKSETITTEELQKFLIQYQLTQKQAAEILKIGEKNFSRWLNGRQRVSASMSNYIRTLSAVPEAFETLRKKQWKSPAAFPAEHR